MGSAPHTWPYSCPAAFHLRPLCPAPIKSLSLSLECIAPRARRSWNFSNSLVTKAWACAKGAWQCLMCLLHRCLAVLTAGGTVPDQQALGPPMFSLSTLFIHCGAHCLLTRNSNIPAIMSLFCAMLLPTWLLK